VASVMKPVRRLEFALRTLLVTVLEVALIRLSHSDIFVRLAFVPPLLRLAFDSTVFCLSAMLVGNAFKGRLLDARLPRWCMWPIFLIWAFATLMLDLGMHYWPVGLVLFAPLLVAGGVVPNKPVLVRPESMDIIAEDDGKTTVPNKKIPARLLVGPIGFLRSLLTIACFWFPFIWLGDTSGRAVRVFVVNFGFCILYFVWTFKVVGRFADSGRSSIWFWFPFCIAASTVSMLPLWYKLINEYEALALFLLIQIPLALLPSNRSREEQSPPPRVLTGIRRDLERKAKSVQPLLVGTLAFLLRLVVIAALWALLIYMESGSSDEIVMWFARFSYFILGVAWMVNANGRLEDAGWAHSWYPSQYFLVVSVASLMPLAVHWVNGYGALAIFVIIQIPTVFLKSKPRPEDPSPDGATLDESKAGAAHS
jgi:hypothetical protein